VRNTASKDKNVRLVRAYHTATETTMEYTGYGFTLWVKHTKDTQGWRVQGVPGTHKKSAAIALVAKALFDLQGV